MNKDSASLLQEHARSLFEDSEARVMKCLPQAKDIFSVLCLTSKYSGVVDMKLLRRVLTILADTISLSAFSFFLKHFFYC